MSGKKYIHHCPHVVVIACLIALIGKITAQTSQVTPNAENSADWEKNFIDGGITASSQTNVRTELSRLTSIQGHVVGEFQITNLSTTAVELTGKETGDGKFWPDVVREVTSGQTEPEWKWQRLSPAAVTDKTVTLIITPQTVSKPLFVDMDVFKEAIDKATFGRVVFTNGRWSMFELSDLLPSKK